MTTPATVVRASVEQERAFQRAAASAAGLPTGPLPGYTVGSIWEGYEPAKYVVKRLAGPRELTVIFGQSGHFKSVFAIDLALSVAMGSDFHGMKTRKAGVLYVAGEGHGGVKKRLRAWLMSRGFDSTSEQQPALFVTTAGADLIGNPEQLRATVEAAAAALGAPIELVVIDTLAANFGPGDENLAADMGLAIAGAREAVGDAALVFVHHTGHGNVERERGSYALIAAADYRVQATYDEASKLIGLKWLKCKDDERPEPLMFEWRRVPLDWLDADGEELTSVILERSESATLPEGPRATGLGKNQQLGLKALRTLYERARKNLQEQARDPAEASILLDGWRNECERRGLDRKRWPEVLKELQERRFVVKDGPHVRLVEGVS